MKKSDLSKAELHQQAEAKLIERKKKTGPLPETEKDTRRLVHELQVNQIELEIQNEELVQARAEAEESYRQYTDLYDFAPVGYFTLAQDGTISRVNLAGATLLGVEHGKLVKRRLGLFVSCESRPAFSDFLESLLSGEGKKICEVTLLKNRDEPFWARLEATCFEGGDECHAVMVDITERVQAEEELLVTQEALEAANLKLQIALTREKQLAHTDVLTGIHNRRYLFELAGHEFEIATRYQQPLSVIMFDLDHFKEVNDSFGHAAGDQILQLVTQAASKELRSADVIGRYGGEEFVIVLPMTNAQQALPLAERIRLGVAAIRVPTEKGDASVTLSLGIVELIHGAQSAQTRSAEDLIRRADEAMYAAKQAGRNRTEIGE
jgi:diguanylate cyclase (GGDEF)-like protein/PAS domain S-box-containing protein